MSDWISIGAQRLRREGEVVFMRLSGTVNMVEAAQLMAELEQVHAQHGRLFLLFDGTQVAGLEPAVRRRFVEWNRDHPIAAVANFGGGSLQRALAILLFNAIRLMVKNTPRFTYVETEELARAWLDEQRRQLSS